MAPGGYPGGFLIEDVPGRAVRFGDRWVRDVTITIGEDNLRLIANGYMCLNCLERLEHAFPERCPNDWCGYPIRRDQPAAFERAFGGVDHEQVRTYERARKAGIVVP
jgi:hypothetical protein